MVVLPSCVLAEVCLSSPGSATCGDTGVPAGWWPSAMPNTKLPLRSQFRRTPFLPERLRSPKPPPSGRPPADI